MAQHNIRRLTGADAEEAGALLARAFLDQPIFVAAVPDRAKRLRLCPPQFAAQIRYGCRYGEAWAIGPTPRAMAGVVYWMAVPYPPYTQELFAASGFDAADREWDIGMEYVEEVVEQGIAHIADLPEKWRYLDMIGLDPDWQRQGLGSALLRKVVADAEAAGVPVGLVTDRPENVPLYQRVGFELTWEGVSRDGNVPLWSFRTYPPAGGSSAASSPPDAATTNYTGRSSV